MTNPAEGYESYMVPTLFAPWAARLVEPRNQSPANASWTWGAAPGIVARQVASHVGANGTVTGIDPNPNMLAVARTAAARDGVAIEWLEGRAEKLPFADNSFDVVLSQFALMFFTDKVAALAEMRRVVTANGRVFLSVWQGLDRHPFYATLNDVIQQRLGMAVLQEIFALGNAEALRALALQAGFQRVEIQPISMTARFPNPAGSWRERSRWIRPRFRRCNILIPQPAKPSSPPSPRT